MRFRNTISNTPTSLNYLGVGVSNSGVSDHYFDGFEVTSNAPAVPTLSAWAVLALTALLILGCLQWMRRTA